MLREDLRGQGLSEEQARAEAGRRFGDVERYRKLCADVALKERRVLARINLVLLVIVMVGVGVLSWRSFASQARTAEAVERLSLKIEQMSAGGGSRAEPAPPSNGANPRPERSGESLIVVDAFGRAAELQFTPEMIERNRSLRAEMFAAYDEKCRGAGYTTLQARTQTVLVVGEVDRPGVYDIVRATSTKTNRVKTLADVLRGASVRSSAKGIFIWRPSATDSAPDQPLAWAFDPEFGFEPGTIVYVSKQPLEWLKYNSPYSNVQVLNKDGRRGMVAEIFALEAWKEIERWRGYDKMLHDLMRLGARRVEPTGETWPLASGQVFNDREQLDGAIDLITAGTDPRGQRLLVNFQGRSVTATLAMVLAGQEGLGEKDANELDIFANQIRSLAKQGEIRVRVIDRLSGSTDPVLDLSWNDAKASQTVVMPGSLVVFSSVKKDGPGKTSP